MRLSSVSKYIKKKGDGKVKYENPFFFSFSLWNWVQVCCCFIIFWVSCLIFFFLLFYNHLRIPSPALFISSPATLPPLLLPPHPTSASSSSSYFLRLLFSALVLLAPFESNLECLYDFFSPTFLLYQVPPARERGPPYLLQTKRTWMKVRRDDIFL